MARDDGQDGVHSLVDAANIQPVDTETSWRVIEQERLSLADLLEGLSEEQWNHP
jgi:hypothetical protein